MTVEVLDPIRAVATKKQSPSSDTEGPDSLTLIGIGRNTGQTAVSVLVCTHPEA